MEALELDSSSQNILVRLPLANDREGGLLVTRHSNNVTLAHADWNPSGKSHDLLHEGVTLTKWRPVKVFLTRVLTRLKQQVCTETLTFLAVRTH